jgi:hypothetical protein
MGWVTFGNSKTIGTMGSEKGVIIEDIEHIGGARITLERDSDIAPFAITLGIYGLMFHTHFSGNEQEAKAYLENKKAQISEVLVHLQIDEPDQTIAWGEKLHQQENFLENKITQKPLHRSTAPILVQISLGGNFGNSLPLLTKTK